MIGTCPLRISRLPLVATAVLASTGLWSAPASAEAAVSRPSGLDSAVRSAPQIHRVQRAQRVHRVHKAERKAEARRVHPKAQTIQKVQKVQNLKEAVQASLKQTSLKQASLKQRKAVRKQKKTRSVSRVQRNKRIGMELAGRFGWDDERQWRCLERLWTRESNWNHLARNPSSGAHGIPQALPGSKMGGVAADWQTNPETQIKWGLRYIKGRYGTPCGAWAHFGSSGWY